MSESPTTTSPPGPDVGAIAAEEWPQRNIAESSPARGSGFQVVYRQDVLDAIHRHGQSTTKVEVCGVLVGRVYRDTAGPYLLIDACIAGDAAHSHAANVTFTSATWTKIHEQMDRLYPDERIVGWYHTHPAFGIFLSEMDVFIQANFFNLPWQVAMVYDPVAGKEGTFIWRNGVPTQESTLVEPGTAPLAAPREGMSTFDRVFALLVLAFVAILLVLLIIYELRTTALPPAGPVGFSQWSALGHGT